MEERISLQAREVVRDTIAFESYAPVPSLGLLPVNAYLIRAEQPVLIDTNMVVVRDELMDSLRTMIPPADLRWLWITHTDPEHMGSYQQVLDAAPNLQVVTTFVGLAKMSLMGLPVDRVYLINPGQTLDVGDRQLVCGRPPIFDAPETTSIMDSETGAYFSADALGAFLSQPFGAAQDIPPSALRQGMITWASVDSPWVHMVDQRAFRQSLDAIRASEPSIILSSHLPPAVGMTDILLEYLAEAPASPIFQVPDQAAMEKMMAATRVR